MDRKTFVISALGGTTLLGAGLLASIGPGSLLDAHRTAPNRATVTLVKAPSPTIVVPVGHGDTPAGPLGELAGTQR